MAAGSGTPPGGVAALLAAMSGGPPADGAAAGPLPPPPGPGLPPGMDPSMMGPPPPVGPPGMGGPPGLPVPGMPSTDPAAYAALMQRDMQQLQDEQSAAMRMAMQQVLAQPSAMGPQGGYGETGMVMPAGPSDMGPLPGGPPLPGLSPSY